MKKLHRPRGWAMTMRALLHLNPPHRGGRLLRRLAGAGLTVALASSMLVLGGATPAFALGDSNMSLSSSPNPSSAGGFVGLSIFVWDDSGGCATWGTCYIPSGDVGIYVDGTQVATVHPDGSGYDRTRGYHASVYPDAGTHSIRACYQGFDFNGSCATVSQTVNALDSVTSLSQSSDPSIPQQPVSFDASVRDPARGVYAPAGQVQFYEGGNAYGAPVGLISGSDGRMHAVLETSNLSGTQTFTARYLGDRRFNQSVSNQVSHSVMAGTTYTSLYINPNPSIVNQMVTYTVTVNAPSSSVVPTGSVTIYDSAGDTYDAASLDASGVATMRQVATFVGADDLTAVYHGDSSYLPSQSDPVHAVSNTGPLDHLVLAPATATVTAGSGSGTNHVGGSQSYKAEGYDANGYDLGDMTPSTSFTMAGGSCSGATCWSPQVGSHTVTGVDNTASGTATLNVTRGPIYRLDLTPGCCTKIRPGGSQTYSAEGFDAGGNDLGNVTSGTTFAIAPDGTCSGATCSATHPGTHIVTGSDGSIHRSTDLTVVAAPTVTSVHPNGGPVGGGQTVTITGTNFTGATSVKFGTTAAASFTVLNATRISAKAPAHAAGVVDVRVTTASGTTPIVAGDHYTFEAAPTVSSVSPNSGTHLGGQTVTITGTNFTGATAVKFGTTAAASFTVLNATRISAKAPAHAAGVVDVRVTTASGTTPIVAGDHYTFA